MPKISVILPVHNSEPYLRQCLDSILSQTLTDIEVICVENGSIDKSLQILREYETKDNRISVIKQEICNGAGHARNEGMAHATGKYLSILDADDYFEKTMLEQLVSKAEQCSADIVICDVHLFDNATGEIKNGGKLQHRYLPEKEVFSYKDIPDYIFQITTGAAWNRVFRRAFITEHNLQFQCIRISDDIFFTFMAMIKAKRITVLDKKLVYYRQNNQDSQMGARTAYPDAILLATGELRKQLQAEGIFDYVKKSYVNDALIRIIDYMDGMENWSAFKCLYNKIREEFMRDLGITGYEKVVFYDNHLYEQLQQIMKNTPEEWAYSKYFKLKDYERVDAYPFPGDAVPRGSKIVLYGAGNAGKAYYTQLLYSGHCKIVLWVDKQWEEIGFPVSGIDKIPEVSYDFVVIAVIDTKIADDIKKQLVGIGIPEHKIISDAVDISEDNQ